MKRIHSLSILLMCTVSLMLIGPLGISSAGEPGGEESSEGATPEPPMMPYPYDYDFSKDIDDFIYLCPICTTTELIDGLCPVCDEVEEPEYCSICGRVVGEYETLIDGTCDYCRDVYDPEVLTCPDCGSEIVNGECPGCGIYEEEPEYDDYCDDEGCWAGGVYSTYGGDIYYAYGAVRADTTWKESEYDD